MLVPCDRVDFVKIHEVCAEISPVFQVVVATQEEWHTIEFSHYDSAHSFFEYVRHNLEVY